MFDTAIVRHQPPRPSAGTEFVITVRVTAEPAQSVQIAHQIAEALRAALGAGGSQELVLAPRDAAGAATRHPFLEIDARCRTVRLGGTTLELSRLEFDLLLCLARDPGRVFSRDRLLGEVWHAVEPSPSRTVDVHIRRLRGKLGEHDTMITTVRRVGYRLEPDADVAVRD